MSIECILETNSIAPYIKRYGMLDDLLLCNPYSSLSKDQITKYIFSTVGQSIDNISELTCQIQMNLINIFETCDMDYYHLLLFIYMLYNKQCLYELYSYTNQEKLKKFFPWLLSYILLLTCKFNLQTLSTILCSYFDTDKINQLFNDSIFGLSLFISRCNFNLRKIAWQLRYIWNNI
jgi:hypothetical protein